MPNFAKGTDEQRTNDVRASRHPERESQSKSVRLVARTLQLHFEAFHADLKAIHRLNRRHRGRRVVVRHKT